MAPPTQLGQFEQTVLAAILRCGSTAYGVPIHAAVEALAGRRVAMGAVYATLDRLEDKGLVSSWMSGPTPERGGRARRCYRVEKDGEKALRESLSLARRLSEAVEGLLDGRRAPA
ncbi:MAG: helix-turn-helix transcriptional regulator [Pseudomonadota bacterium]|jgi:PadR family transcriptional regulator PadR|nr:MAG: PadR family transcriptional regulator [Pseudomonadota bacterium]